MAEASSARAVFKIDDTGGTLRDLSDYVDETDGLPGPRKLTEVTGLGASGAAYVYVTSLEDTPFSIKGKADDTIASGPDANFDNLSLDATDENVLSALARVAISSGNRMIDLDGKTSDTLTLIEDRSRCAFSAELAAGGVAACGCWSLGLLLCFCLPGAAIGDSNPRPAAENAAIECSIEAGKLGRRPFPPAGPLPMVAACGCWSLGLSVYLERLTDITLGLSCRPPIFR